MYRIFVAKSIFHCAPFWRYFKNQPSLLFVWDKQFRRSLLNGVFNNYNRVNINFDRAALICKWTNVPHSDVIKIWFTSHVQSKYRSRIGILFNALQTNQTSIDVRIRITFESVECRLYALYARVGDYTNSWNRIFRLPLSKVWNHYSRYTY